ncbi:hypothetical protein [uncultured Psychroserpens sp.]|uniref:hypothetical protein n=1 Tax=uncultured Psychroserpens sp. TaxID=255436 RepID=UPI00261F86B8|nr:hypothetical protein [uncultured Psychroserpens sp.]
MMKLILCICLSIFTYKSVYSQEKKTLTQTLAKQDTRSAKLKDILNKKVDSINSHFSNTALRQKLSSKLNTIGKIKTQYQLSAITKLDDDEIKELFSRMAFIAQQFYKEHDFYLFEYSVGWAAPFLIKEKTINNKSVSIINVHGGCVVGEKTKKEAEILEVFNYEMKQLLSKG